MSRNNWQTNPDIRYMRTCLGIRLLRLSRLYAVRYQHVWIGDRTQLTRDIAVVFRAAHRVWTSSAEGTILPDPAVLAWIRHVFRHRAACIATTDPHTQGIILWHDLPDSWQTATVFGPIRTLRTFASRPHASRPPIPVTHHSPAQPQPPPFRSPQSPFRSPQSPFRSPQPFRPGVIIEEDDFFP